MLRLPNANRWGSPQGDPRSCKYPKHDANAPCFFHARTWPHEAGASHFYARRRGLFAAQTGGADRLTKAISGVREERARRKEAAIHE